MPNHPNRSKRKGLHVRWRWLSGASTGEYQLVDGQTVIGRHDLEEQAIRALEAKQRLVDEAAMTILRNSVRKVDPDSIGGILKKNVPA